MVRGDVLFLHFPKYVTIFLVLVTFKSRRLSEHQISYIRDTITIVTFIIISNETTVSSAYLIILQLSLFFWHVIGIYNKKKCWENTSMWITSVWFDDWRTFCFSSYILGSIGEKVKIPELLVRVDVVLL